MSVQTVRFGDLVNVVNDNEYEPIKNCLTKYVAGEHLESKILHITRFGDIKRDVEVIGSAFHRKFLKGNVLFGTRRAYLRKTGIATFDGICANTTLVLKSKQNGLVEGLLPFIVRLEKFTEHAVKRSVGSTNPYVRWRDLADFEFELPNKSEQLQINEILWRIQNSIDSLGNVIQKTKAYYRSKCKLLLTRGIAHTKFKKVKEDFGKIIEIPENWITSTIKDLGNIVTGYTPSTSIQKNYGSDILWATPIDLGSIKYVEDTKTKLSLHGYKSSRSIPEKSILVVCIGSTIGKIGIATQKMTTNQQINSIICNSDENEFVYYQLLFNLQKIYRMTNTTAVPILNKNDFSTIKIHKPKNISEQQKIVLILSNIEKQIIQQQSHLAKLYEVQNAILNSKFKVKGKIIA